jgi:uncharacterized protein
MEEMSQKPSLAKQIFYYPVTGIVIGFFICVGMVAVISNASSALLKLTHVSDDLRKAIVNLEVPLVAIASYYLLYKYYEKRNIGELKLSALPVYGLMGITIGMGLQALVILVIYLMGGYAIVKVNPISYLLPGLLIAISSSAFEEILIRGIVFRIMNEKWGALVALSFSAALFGALHLANKNSTLYSAAAIAVEAGILLGACYLFAGNLWLPIGVHLGWNFALAGIFGAVLSGNTIDKTLLTSKFSGSEYLTGGDFGPENSLPAVIICTAAGIIFLWLAWRKGVFASKEKNIEPVAAAQN